jgi:hypothetical protein
VAVGLAPGEDAVDIDVIGRLGDCVFGELGLLRDIAN